jgi:hypothetical protein
MIPSQLIFLPDVVGGLGTRVAGSATTPESTSAAITELLS